MSFSMQQRQKLLLEGNYVTLVAKILHFIPMFLDKCTVFVSNSKLCPL